MPKPRVFLDSSVIIAALLSSRGGSFYVLTQLRERSLFQINEYVLTEVQGILKNKFRKSSHLSAHMFLLLGLAEVETVSNPTKREVRAAARFISKNDAPILASALAHSDYLLTLDNEFLQARVVEQADREALKILKPGGYIALLNKDGR